MLLYDFFLQNLHSKSLRPYGSATSSFDVVIQLNREITRQSQERKRKIL